MARTWQQYPHEIVIKFPLEGEVTITVTERAHIYVNMKRLVVRGVEHYGSMHLHAKDGWGLETSNTNPVGSRSLYLKQVRDLKDSSEAARKAVVDCIIPQVRGWVACNRSVLEEAERCHLNNLAHSAEKELQKALAEVRRLQSVIGGLDRDLHTLGEVKP